MPQATDNSGYLKNCVARALYDNIGESPDELAFRRGDLLTVLEQNTGGIEGWWLCTLRGRQGICPGNRLRLLAGVFDTGGGNFVAEDDADEDLESLQRLGKRRSWHVQSNKVVTPQRVGDVYLYDLPPTGSQHRPVTGTAAQHWQQHSGDSYDVPRAGALAVAAAQCYDAPRGSPIPLDQGGFDCSSYDVPRAHCTPVLPTLPQYEYDTPPHAPRLTPSSSASSLTAPTTESGSNRSSGMDHCQYDIPPPPVKAIHSEPSPQVHPATFLYDVPPTVTKDICNPAGLPLEQSAALETLSKLENELQAATTKLLGFVSPNWRLKDNLEPKILELKLASHRVKTALHDLLRFCEGALGNAINAADRGLAPKLRLLLRMLRNSEHVLSESTTVLDRSDWNYFNLLRSDDMSQENPDSLDRLISNCKEIPDNTRQACGFIQGNAPLLFKRENEIQSGEEMSGIEDYDYVNLESKASVARSNSETKANLAPQLRDQYESLISSDMEVLNLDPSDKRVLIFFASQAASHAANLTTAIDAFLLTIEQNQPPTSFLAHGKFVVLSAHKLVAIGDSVHRHVAASAVRTRVLQASNSLSDALASAVHKTKKAALHFPSVSAVQEMVDSVVDISHLARDLKLQISQAAHSG